LSGWESASTTVLKKTCTIPNNTIMFEIMEGENSMPNVSFVSHRSH